MNGLDVGQLVPFLVAGIVLGLLLFSVLRVGNTEVTETHWALQILRDAPFPIWLKRCDGQVWGNRICSEQYETLIEGNSVVEPLQEQMGLRKVLFDGVMGLEFYQHKATDCSTYFGLPNWNKKTVIPKIPLADGASDALNAVPVGIACFDKDMGLKLFNTALSEFLELPTRWLNSQPSLRSFLNRLHDDGFLPEPKDFRKWCDGIVNLEHNKQGFYQEHWYLPADAVLKVTGQVQENGDLMFHFEDASPYIFIERAYRQETAQLRGAMDTSTDAIVVFDAMGEILFTNARFVELWDLDAQSVAPKRATDLMPIWQDACEPTPIWGDVRDDLASLNPRSKWEGIVFLKNQTALDATFNPIKHGGYVCQFRTSKTLAVIKKIA